MTIENFGENTVDTLSEEQVKMERLEHLNLAILGEEDVAVKLAMQEEILALETELGLVS